MKPGDRLLTSTGSYAEVVSVVLEDRPLQAYNLEVDGYHTFFVAAPDNDDAPAVWVHNSCPLYGPIADFRRQLAESGNAPKWMNQWLRQGRSPPGHHVDHLLSVGGTDDPANLRLKTIADLSIGIASTGRGRSR